MHYLERVRRPVVDFDPANVEHRIIYQQFMKTNSWDHSPILFDMPEKYLELPYYINMRLTEFYMDQDKKMQKHVDKNVV
jgi:hypothetical protein